MNKKRNKTNNTASTAGSSSNYFAPLQTIDEDNLDDSSTPDQPVKVHISPITILKCKTEEAHVLCRSQNVQNYSIRKISIGIKLMVNSKSDFDKICSLLTDKYEYFTYATKAERPYKALLFGLDKQDPSIIKRHLINMGLQCLDVKLVEKKGSNNKPDFIIFVVYFQRRSITMR